MTVLRYAIRTEIRLITSELATDLARFPGLNSWSTEDFNILASLFVDSMIIIAEAIEEAHTAAALDEIKRTAVKQLRMITVGVNAWQPAPEGEHDEAADEDVAAAASAATPEA